MTGYADSLIEQYKHRPSGGEGSKPPISIARIILHLKLSEPESEGGTGNPSKHNHMADKYSPYRGTHCWYCDRMFYFHRSVMYSRGVLILTKDHIRPLSRKGSNYMSNLIACCQDCNSIKKDYTLKEFVLFLKGQCPGKMMPFRKLMIARAYKLHNKRKRFIKN